MRRDVVALFNYSGKPATVSCGVDVIGLPKAERYVAFDFWANQFAPAFGQMLACELPPHSCRVLAIKPVAPIPQLLSTSRHVTQGIVDVTGEQWDAAARTLSATSRVVGNDPYELRIVVPEGGKPWIAGEVSVSSEDAAAGVKTEFKQDGPHIRATLTSASNREVKWAVKF